MDDREFRESIKEILVEARTKVLDEAEEALGLTEAGDEFGDVDLGDWRDIQAIAVNPVKNVLSTGWGNILKIGSKARKLVDTLKAGVKSMVLPFVAGDFQKIFQRDAARQRAIESKYGNIVTRARDLLKDDVMLGAFLLNPALMLASVASYGSSQKVLELTKVLIGDNAPATKSIDKMLRSMFGESMLRNSLLEASIEDKRRVMSLLNDLKDEIRASPTVRELQQAEQNRYNTTLNELIDRAEEVSKLASLDDVERFYGKGISAADVKNAAEDEGQAAEMAETIVEKVKAVHLQAMVAALEAKVKYLERMRVPEAAGIITAHQNAISRIKQQLPKGIAAESVLRESDEMSPKQVAFEAYVAADAIYDALDEFGLTDRKLNMHQTQVLGDWLGVSHPSGPKDRSFSVALDYAGGSPELLVKRLADGINNVMHELNIRNMGFSFEDIKKPYAIVNQAMKWFESRGTKRVKSDIPSLLWKGAAADTQSQARSKTQINFDRADTVKKKPKPR